MILTFVGGAESVTGRILQVVAERNQRPINPQKVASLPMSEKLKAVRAFIARDGSAIDERFSEIERVYEAIATNRHTLAHGFPAATADGPCVVNFRNRHVVWMNNLEGVLADALRLRRACYEMSVQMARGGSHL